MIGLRKLLSRYALPFLAAAIPVATLLILFEVHTAVIRRGLTLIGMRSDVPVIFATRDACGNETPRIRVLDDGDRDRELEGDRRCFEDVSILISKRPNITVSLYVNNELVARDGRNSRIVRFDGVRAEQAVNSVYVAADDEQIWHPFGTRQSIRRLLLSGFDQDFASPPSSVWDRPTSRPLGLIGLRGPQMPTPLEELGVWQSRDGDYLGLVSGRPVSVLPETVFGVDTTGSGQPFTDMAGLAVISLTPEAAKGRPEPPFYRRLRIERHANGALAVEAETCLPAAHPLHARILPEDAKSDPGVLPISGPHFVNRFFNVQIGRWSRERLDVPPAWGVARYGTGGDDACRPVAVAFRIEKDARFSLRQEAASSFPNLSNDELEVVGFGDDLFQYGRVASSASGGAQRWIVGAGGVPYSRLSLDYFGGRQNVGQSRRSDDRVFSQYRQLFEALPDRFRYFLYLFAPILPATLILLVARNAVRSTDADPERFHMAVRGLTALVFFGIAWALVPFAQRFAYWLMDFVRLGQSVRDLATGTYIRSNESVPAAILVVVLALVLLRRDTVAEEKGTKVGAFLGYVLSLLITVAVLGLGMVALRVQYLLTNEAFAEELAQEAAGLPYLEWLDSTVFVGTAGPLWMTLLWAIVVSLLATITVAWVLRRLSGPMGTRTAFGATFTVFLLALVPTLTDTAAMGVALVSYENWNFGGIIRFIQDAIEFAARIAPRAILFLLVYLVFFRIIRFVRESIEVKERLSMRALAILLAIMVTLSLAGQRPAGQQTLNVDLVLLTGLAHSYAPLIALVLGFFLLDAMRPQTAPAPEETGSQPLPDLFCLPESSYLICTAAFASYVATWSLNPVTLLPVIVVGWFIFARFILSPTNGAAARAEPNLASRYVEYLKASHLAAQVRQSARTAFAKGELSLREFRLRNTQAENHERDFIEILNVEERGGAKELILGRGPEDSPMKNSKRGALAGLATALVLQALAPLNSTIGEIGVEGGWLTFANLILADASYDIVRGSGGAPEVWLAVAQIVNALTLWVTAGFLFGFVFHRIRGGDGFVKAVRFSLGVAIAVLVAQAIAGGSGSLELAAQVLPLSIFLLITGTLVFDGASLRTQNLGYADLVEIYGLQTSLGYASLAGALAGLAPLLTLLGVIG